MHTIIWLPFLALFAVALQAAPITAPTDPTLSGASLIDFESNSLGSYPTLSTSGATFSHAAAVTVPPTFNGFHITDSSNAYVPVTSKVLEYSTVDRSDGSSPDIALKIEFDQAVSAFGMDYIWGIYPTNLKAYDSTDTLIESILLPPTNEVGGSYYTGLAATTANIKYAIISGIGTDRITIDNLAYAGAAATVPLPAAFWLFCSAFFALLPITKTRHSDSLSRE